MNIFLNKKLIVLITIGTALIGGVLFVKIGNLGTAAIWNISGQGQFLLPLIAVAALIDSINPCAFSILLLTIAFLFSIGRLRTKILQVGSSYIAGIFIVYVAIGLGILQTLHLFNTPHFMAKIGASLLIALGAINIVNELFPAFPIKLRIPSIAHAKMAELMEKGSVLTAFLLGGLVGICEFPCTGGPYLMILGLLHDTSSYLFGFGYLLLYNAIFVLPLIIILLIAADKSLLEKVSALQKRESRFMRFGGGIAMVVLGIVIFFL